MKERVEGAYLIRLHVEERQVCRRCVRGRSDLPEHVALHQRKRAEEEGTEAECEHDGARLVAGAVEIGDAVAYDESPRQLRELSRQARAKRRGEPGHANCGGDPRTHPEAHHSAVGAGDAHGGDARGEQRAGDQSRGVAPRGS